MRRQAPTGACHRDHDHEGGCGVVEVVGRHDHGRSFPALLMSHGLTEVHQPHLAASRLGRGHSNPSLSTLASCSRSNLSVSKLRGSWAMSSYVCWNAFQNHRSSRAESASTISAARVWCVSSASRSSLALVSSGMRTSELMGVVYNLVNHDVYRAS